MALFWTRRNRKNATYLESTNGRFRVAWCSRRAYYWLYDCNTGRRYPGFFNPGNACDAAIAIGNNDTEEVVRLQKVGW